MVRFTSVIALAGLASLALANKDETPKVRDSKRYEDIDWSLVRYDPNTADTVEDAAWNCIVDFAEIEPRWACDFRNTIAQDYANMCTPNGNVELMRKLVYPFCDLRTRTKPQKRPSLKQANRNTAEASASQTTETISTDTDANDDVESSGKEAVASTKSTKAAMPAKVVPSSMARMPTPDVIILQGTRKPGPQTIVLTSFVTVTQTATSAETITVTSPISYLDGLDDEEDLDPVSEDGTSDDERDEYCEACD